MQSSQQVTLAEALEMALAHHRAGRLREADEIYRQILAGYPEFPPALHMRGVVLFQTGKKEEGIALIRRSLVLQPNYPEALSNLGHLLRESGRLEEAIECCKRAIEMQPNLPEGYVNLGSAHYALGRFEEAANCHRQALVLRPEYPDAYTNLGNALQAMGMHTEAVEAHRKAVRLRPEFPEAHNNLAAALHALGNVDEAIEHYNLALKVKPDYPEALSNLGHAMQSKKKFDEAIVLCRRAIQLQPTNTDAFNNLGNALQEKGKTAEALACFRQALVLDPRHADALNNMGNSLQELGKMEESIACYHRAIEARPIFAKAYGNLGNALRALGRIDESIAVCQRAVEMQPTLEEAHVNLGTALHMAGRYSEGIAACKKAIEIRQDFPEAHKDLSLMLLVQGMFEEGWREYEWRLKLPNYFNSPSRFRQPMWDGSELGGRKILVHAEQGLGDTIHFARFLPMVERRGGRIILECQAELTRLMKQTEILQNVEIVPRDSKSGPAVPFDIHVPLLSLPLLLGKLDPAVDRDVVQPPYMKPDQMLHDQWRERLGEGRSLKIGLTWAGSATNKNDRHRSITLAMLAPLAREGVDFYSLQFGKPAEQAANPPAGMKLIDHTAKIADFAETAALVAELDLIICVDTAVAHLAGAMGKPVWAMLQYIPDFRWRMEGQTTPWYPSIRLFRQRKIGDWPELIERVAAELGQWVRNRL